MRFPSYTPPLSLRATLLTRSLHAVLVGVLVSGCTTALVWLCVVVADVVDIDVVGVEVVGAEILEAEAMDRILLYLDVFPVAFLCFCLCEVGHGFWC